MKWKYERKHERRCIRPARDTDEDANHSRLLSKTDTG